MENKNLKVASSDSSLNTDYMCGPIMCVPSSYAHKTQMCSPVKCVPSSHFHTSDNPICNKQSSTLDFLWLEITQKCNLRCLHCYSDSSPLLPLMNKMTYENWRSILRDAFTLGCRKVQFTGGEPTLNQYLPQLIADARNIGYEFIEVFTNGTLLNNDLFKTFHEFNVNLAFTVYASQADIHDTITQQSGSFLKTIIGIRQAIDNGLFVRVGIIKMHLNSNYFEHTATFLRDLGVRSINSDQVRDVGRGNTNSPNSFIFTESCGTCLHNTICIDSNGQAFPCVFARLYPVGNITNGLKTILKSNKLHMSRRRVHEEMTGNQRKVSPSIPCT